MSFIEAYKHLEKLCGEVLDDDRRISAYIDEMINKPRGQYIISGWNEDLKKLKHYRWVRNKITHEPDCTEENMCEPNDTVWLQNFYSRIMNQTDPLTLYAKATNQNRLSQYNNKTHSIPYTNTNRKKTGFLAVLAYLAIVAAVIFLIQMLIRYIY